MASDASFEVLTPLYGRWVDALLGAPIPNERKATCSDCPMCSDEPPAGSIAFKPDLKCCTFFPALANFLVGGILEDAELPHGRAAVERILASRHAVSPLGIQTPPRYAMLFKHGRMSMGQSVALRCPFLVEEGGLCGIWRQRNSTCSTWFCKYERGSIGLGFWTALRELLAEVERDLSIWCALEVGLDAEASRHVFAPVDKYHEPLLRAHHLDGAPDPEHGGRWGGWAGREGEFFRECARRAAPLGWDDVLQRTGPRVRALAGVAKAAFARMTGPGVPSHPRVGMFQIHPNTRGRANVTGYSMYDPLDVPAKLLDVLPAFDGRPLDEVRAELRAKQLGNFDDELVQMLTDYGLLVETKPG